MAAEALPNFDRAPESRASSSPHGWGDRAWITDWGVWPWPVKTDKKCPKNMEISMGFKHVQTTCSIEMWWQMPFDLMYIQKKNVDFAGSRCHVGGTSGLSNTTVSSVPPAGNSLLSQPRGKWWEKGRKTMGHNGGFPMGSLKTMGFNTEMVDDLDDFWW